MDFKQSEFLTSMRAPLIGATLAVSALANPATAETIRVDGAFYDIQFFEFGDSFEDNETALTSTPWWNDADLALDIADTFLNTVGVEDSPFIDDDTDFTEVRFASGFVDGGDDAVNFEFLREMFDNILPSEGSGSVTSGSNQSDGNVAYAYVDSVTPVPLPPAGLALVFGVASLFGLRRWKVKRTA